MDFTHIDELGNVQMVDVSEKKVTKRLALAYGEIRALPETIRQISADEIGKGDVLTVAKIAGISGAKRTGELIPMCHPIPLNHVEIDFTLNEDEGKISILSSATALGKTGVEMEALTAASLAALTIYDMCKSADRSMVIGPLMLVEKQGGKSGIYKRLGWKNPSNS
tara:strand:+ start:48063 stop:48560 length:498 start_codon:yes stop_codon:yes gene_type:complete